MRTIPKYLSWITISALVLMPICVWTFTMPAWRIHSNSIRASTIRESMWRWASAKWWVVASVQKICRKSCVWKSMVKLSNYHHVRVLLYWIYWGKCQGGRYVPEILILMLLLCFCTFIAGAVVLIPGVRIRMIVSQHPIIMMVYWRLLVLLVWYTWDKYNRAYVMQIV